MLARRHDMREYFLMVIAKFSTLKDTRALVLACIVLCGGTISTFSHAQGTTVFPSPAILPTLKPPPASQPEDLTPRSEVISAEDRTLFIQAMRESKRRRWTRARSTAAKAESPIPRKIIDWIYMRQPGANIDFLERKAFIAVNPSWPLLTELHRRAE